MIVGARRALSSGRRAIRFAALLLLASTGIALAAGLTADDYRYLQTEYGVGRDNVVLKGMTQVERTRLHEIIYGYGLRNDRASRDDAVRARLYEAYARECGAWALDHGGEECPPAKDVTVEPGKKNCRPALQSVPPVRWRDGTVILWAVAPEALGRHECRERAGA